MTQSLLTGRVGFDLRCGRPGRVERNPPCRRVYGVGFDLPCAAGHLGLKRAAGTFLRALGFESHPSKKYRHPDGCLYFLADRVGFEPTSPLLDYLISSQGRYDHFDTCPCAV